MLKQQYILIKSILPFAPQCPIFEKNIMQMRLLFSFLFISFLMHTAKGQHYYNDIIVTGEVNKQHTLLRSNHIQQVIAKSYDNNNQLIEGFSIEQEIQNNAGRIITTTTSPSDGKSTSVNYYTNNHLSKTIDVVGYVSSTAIYLYNDSNRLISINTIINDTFMNSNSEELHEWKFENNKPIYMSRIKNKVDTIKVEFITDEAGNITEEHWKKKGLETEAYYYYYNNKQQLTDIVRFNKKAKRLLPEFLFEYDDKNLLIQLTQIPQNAGGYLTWQYIYNTAGLKQKEICFDKQKQIIGHIEYTYQ